MPIQLKVKVKSEKHNLKATSSKYHKDFKDLLRDAGAKGVEKIRTEIKKRNLSENDDIVNYSVTGNKLSFTLDLDSGKKIDKEIDPTQTTLAEAIDPEVLEKLVPSSNPKLEAGFHKGVEEVKKNLISEIRKLTLRTIANV